MPIPRKLAASSAALALSLLQSSAFAQHAADHTVVHIVGTPSPVFLQRNGGSTVSVASTHTTIVTSAPNQPEITASSFTVSSIDFWAPACASPCGIALPRSEQYRAYNGVPSVPFHLPPGEVVLQLHPGSAGAIAAGAIGVSVGGLALISGTTVGILAATDAEIAARPGFVPVAITLASVGSALAALGIWGIYAGMSHVDDLTHRRRLARAPRVSFDGVALHF